MKFYALITAAFLSTPSLAADVTIEMLNKDADGNRMVYSQEMAKKLKSLLIRQEFTTTGARLIRGWV